MKRGAAPHRLSFRVKLLLAMMGVVIGVTGAILYVTHGRVADAYSRFFQQQFESEIGHFNSVQALRLSGIARRCENFANSIRLRGPMREVLRLGEEAQDPAEARAAAEVAYKNAEDRLQELLGAGEEGPGTPELQFFRLADGQNRELKPAPGIDAGLTRALASGAGKKQLQQLIEGLAEAQEIGYLAVPAVGQSGRILEVVVTTIQDEDDTPLGKLILGFSMPAVGGIEESRAAEADLFEFGVWLEDRLYAPHMKAELQEAIRVALVRELAGVPSGVMDLRVRAGEDWRVFCRPLTRNPEFPRAYQVCAYSLASALAEQRGLRWVILSLGAGGVLVALLFSGLLSHGLSVPIRALSKATGEVQRGNLEVRVPVRSGDELGRLAGAFNEMTAGLALKERYRSVLNMVADKEVAEQLMTGEVALGGETRRISVLFCDIRGFTALTQNMDPAEVIQLLNEHMTILTRVVYEHHGVVDKFVGDLIMAIFGAPKSYGRDAHHAARCALDMIRAREELNRTCRYPIRVGIGVATGLAVAGCMGSADRLNYTVLGERVNLASRLCGQAGPMEVVIDESTHQSVETLAQVEPLPPVKLKGFAEPVQAYKLRDIQPIAENE